MTKKLNIRSRSSIRNNGGPIEDLVLAYDMTIPWSNGVLCSFKEYYKAEDLKTKTIVDFYVAEDDYYSFTTSLDSKLLSGYRDSLNILIEELNNPSNKMSLVPKPWPKEKKA